MSFWDRSDGGIEIPTYLTRLRPNEWVPPEGLPPRGPSPPRQRGEGGASAPGEGPPTSHFGRSRHRSCNHTHCSGARRICASIAAVSRAVSAIGSSPRATSIGSENVSTYFEPRR